MSKINIALAVTSLNPTLHILTKQNRDLKFSNALGSDEGS